MHVYLLCACWYLWAVKGSSSLSFCRLPISLRFTSCHLLCPKLTDAPYSGPGSRPPPPFSKMASSFTGSAHSPFSGYDTTTKTCIYGKMATISLEPAPQSQFHMSSDGIQRAWRQPGLGRPLLIRDRLLQGLAIISVSKLHFKIIMLRNPPVFFTVHTLYIFLCLVHIMSEK
jgi:hypothetical protein